MTAMSQHATGGQSVRERNCAAHQVLPAGRLSDVPLQLTGRALSHPQSSHCKDGVEGDGTIEIGTKLCGSVRTCCFGSLRKTGSSDINRPRDRAGAVPVA